MADGHWMFADEQPGEPGSHVHASGCTAGGRSPSPGDLLRFDYCDGRPPIYGLVLAVRVVDGATEVDMLSDLGIEVPEGWPPP